MRSEHLRPGIYARMADTIKGQGPWCNWCEKSIYGKRAGAKFCCPACKQAWYRKFKTFRSQLGNSSTKTVTVTSPIRELNVTNFGDLSTSGIVKGVIS